MVVKNKVNEDLQRERIQCNFDIEELTNFLDGGKETTNYRRKTEDKVLQVKGLLDEVPEEYLSLKEKYENAIRKGVLLYKTLQDIKKSSEAGHIINFRDTVETAIFKENNPFLLHTNMFLTAIIQQGTEEQQKRWLHRGQSLEIIGTYAQTELGHGTFLRGLETTATYDAKTEEFVLHSPTLTSYKWWPGGLANTASYCIVMAQLYINQKNYGIQPFMVQLRDENTHEPLSGIKIGDIGAKMGFNTVNNGFLGFDNFRIPRTNMLMKNTQVLKDGTFIESPNSKLAYGTMVLVRVVLVNIASNHLAKAVTIAVRYSAVRRQSQLKANEAELQILDYVTQQHKLFIAIASSYAFTTIAKWFRGIYDAFTEDMKIGKLDKLPEIHSLACCLKAVSTADVTAFVERCRLSCGGHGYMMSSSFPQLYSTVLAGCTIEGDNTVLMLQTARSLVKSWHVASKGGNLSSTVAYIKDRPTSYRWSNTVDGIITGFQLVALGKLDSCVKSLENYIKSGLSSEDAWNMITVQLVATAEVHCRSIIMSVFKSEMDRTSTQLSAPVKTVVYQLVELYAVYWALERLGDLLLFTSISRSDVVELQHRYEELLSQIRPNAVGIVDAFDFRDEILSSTLGAYDGRVYERLMEEALKSPLNKETVNYTFHKYLKPFMQGKL